MCSKLAPDTRMQVVEPVNRDPIQDIVPLLRLIMSLAFWHSPIPLWSSHIIKNTCILREGENNKKRKEKQGYRK